MKSTGYRHSLFAALLLMFAASLDAAEIKRITNLYDAFGPLSTALVKDWGFAALVEYGGRRVLFDTGNHADTFEHNVKALGIDLTKLDAVVISHRHGDHTSGLSYLLKVNPGVTIYVPREAAFFKSSLPREFLQHQPDLPVSLRYFEGKEPQRWDTGSPWQDANFQIVTDTTTWFAPRSPRFATSVMHSAT